MTASFIKSISDLFVLANVNAIKSLRFFIQADNFLTWAAGKEGMDPELNITGQTGQRSSSFKTLSAGLNVGF
ncbi:MAG: hypothetical protein EOO43_19075 [Flavobacterium sp.]|nr:MAG: hypothetical protein EOO43_19075 [Flavobacterium sp.]